MNKEINDGIKDIYKRLENDKFNSFVNAAIWNIIMILMVYASIHSIFVSVIVSILFMLHLIGYYFLDYENYKLHLKHNYCIFIFPLEVLYQSVLVYILITFTIPTVVAGLVIINILLFIKGLLLFMKMKLYGELK